MSGEKQDLYKDSGVDTELGDGLVDWLNTGTDIRRSPLGEVVSGIGGFAALWRPNFAGMKDPLLVSSTDGVGTKVLLGLEYDRLEGLGVDLVGMCVNDLYTLGARPMFFLDYYATGVLNADQFKRILTGIRAGLAQCETALLGGETAEMPGLYAHGHFDLAGFVVGAVDGTARLGPERVKAGDKIVALRSDGFHSNGFSLVRKWLKEHAEPTPMMDHIMRPTRIYHCVPQLLAELGPERLHALAHITGGGISGNLTRALPEGLDAKMARDRLPTPEWMRALIARHGARFDDVEGVFNLGAGMMAIVAADAAGDFRDGAERLGFPGVIVGEVVAGRGEPRVIYE